MNHKQCLYLKNDRFSLFEYLQWFCRIIIDRKSRVEVPVGIGDV